jgi:hypothetical protein
MADRIPGMSGPLPWAGLVVRFPTEAKHFFLIHMVYIDSGALQLS